MLDTKQKSSDPSSEKKQDKTSSGRHSSNDLQEQSSRRSGKLESEDEKKRLDLDFPPFETSARRPSPQVNEESTNKETLPSIDDVLASKLRPTPTTLLATAPSPSHKKSQHQKKAPSAKKQLQKFKFEDDSSSAPKQTLLESTDTDQPFDQFKGKKTDFSMDIYSVKMPDKVDPELQARADRLEREIGQGHDEEQIFNMVDEDCKMRRERRTAVAATEIASAEEKLFGTALNDDQKADYKTAFTPASENNKDDADD